MDDHPSDKDPNDIEAQLRRYAEAAEAQVPSTPDLTGTDRRRATRPLLAAAAVLVLLGGAVAVFVGTRGDDVVETVDRDTPVRETCPTPAADPKPTDLQVAMPWVTSASTGEATGGSPSSGRIQVDFGKGTDKWVQVVVKDEPNGVEELQPLPGAPGEQRLIVCDPFSGSTKSTEVIGFATGLDPEGDDQRSLDFAVGDRWLVSILAGPESESALSVNDLVAVASGLAWPAPIVEPTTVAPPTTAQRPAGEPSATCLPGTDDIVVGDHTLARVPAGFTPELPPTTVEDGAADEGGTRTTTLRLVDAGGGTIDVISFTSYSPVAFIDEQHGGAEVREASVEQCVPGIEGPTAQPATESGPGDRSVIGSQEWEYGGYVVVASEFVPTADLRQVAEALRRNG